MAHNIAKITACLSFFVILCTVCAAFLLYSDWMTHQAKQKPLPVIQVGVAEYIYVGKDEIQIVEKVGDEEKEDEAE